MSATRVTSNDLVATLVAGLLDRRRARPWGVVSIPVGADAPLIDIGHLHDEVGDVCELFVIQTGDLTRQFAALLPDRCQVYGGASRIYPVDLSWTAEPERSPLRFVHNLQQAASVTDLLITDALGMANDAGLFAQAAPSAVRVRGVVKRLIADGARALVQLDSGDIAAVLHELTFPEIPLEWVVHEGQRVEGLFDPQTKRLSLDVTRPSSAELLELYPHGTVTLALVLSVERQKGVLAVHPSAPIEVARAEVSSNPFDRVDLLLAPGDVVPVRVIRDPQGRTGLRLNDLDDDEEVLPALALVPDGDPWLVEDRHRPSEADETPDASELPDLMETVGGDGHEYESDGELTLVTAAPVGPRPGPGSRPAVALLQGAVEVEEPVVRSSTALQSTQLALERERARNRELEAQLRSAGGVGARELSATLRLELGEKLAENHRLREELRRLRGEQQTQRAMLRASRQQSAASGYRERKERFDDPAAWIRHELYLAWIERLDESDRATWPLPPDYAVGERFAGSLDDLDDGYLAKAFKATVDVLTGRVREIAARRPHPLRTGSGTGEADVVRADGARCMRVHIEKHVASARRLHYWQRVDGSIELSRVVLHDDMEP